MVALTVAACGDARTERKSGSACTEALPVAPETPAGAPTTVCGFAEPTDPMHIEPATRVYFDGGGSFEPTNPTDPTLITAFRWEVVDMPDGANPADFQQQGWGTSRASFFVPLAGCYVVSLIVDANDLTSAPSYCEFDAVSPERSP